MTFGILNLAKPSGVSSRQVVNSVQRLVRPAKAGHAGTLDPIASGVLVVCVGVATRLIEYVQRMPKRYHATFLLGRASDTEDATGEVREQPSAPQPTREEVCQATARFVGPIMQRPPAFSALKVAGKRAYQLARQGREVDLQPRQVEIYELEVVRYEYPELVLDIACSSGTYVRSLGRDLAESLGTVAVMSALVRTAVGHYRLEDAVEPDQLTAESLESALLAPLAALGDMPRLNVSETEIARLFDGAPITRGDAPDCEELAAVDPSGRLVSILVPARPGFWNPKRNFKQDSS